VRPYIGIFKTQFKQGIQYRTAAIAGIATQFFFGWVFIAIFSAFYGDQTAVNGFTKAQMTTYIWLQQAFLAFIMLWYRDNSLFEMIRTGHVAYELCRPLNIYAHWYARLFSQRLSSGLLRCVPILLLTALFPFGFGLSLPETPISAMLFVISLLLGLMINTAISMFVYISVFVTLSPAGSLLIFGIVGEFFSGGTLPIPLMPMMLQRVVAFLPFAYTADFPFRVYSGNIGTVEALAGIGIQLLWLVLLPFIGNRLMNGTLKKLVIQGG
jgi:ABC-2 type transport system permease protein